MHSPTRRSEKSERTMAASVVVLDPKPSSEPCHRSHLRNTIRTATTSHQWPLMMTTSMVASNPSSANSSSSTFRRST
ncbi:hypothetical protein U1Q18_034228 [Sarracenia purpurea var. burkii]